ncbi:MAG: DHHW family protein [Firmicutes bacterium]|nr:DHHW family protein [Bacillota bacterium]
MKNLYKKIMIIIFSLFLVTMPILTIVYLSPEERPFSENENRYLAKFPTLSAETYKNKKFMNGFDTWISDRFIGREQWIELKNTSNKIIGKTEINGVFIENNMMMEAWEGYDREVYEKNLNAINNFANNHKNIQMFFMLAPNAQEIYKNNIPAFAPVENQKKFIEGFYSSLMGFEGTIDVYSALQEKSESSYIYYRTDHHWTSFGAFLAYQAAAPALGYESYPYSAFEIEHASHDFRGTLFSKTLDFGVTPDIIDYYTVAKGEPEVKVSVYDKYDNSTGKIKYKEYDSMYFRDFLEVKDKYSSFLGQNSPLVTIENPAAKSEKRLLVIKDSYAHSLVPFLSKEYQKVTMIDLRYINTDFQTMAPLSDYDQLLFMYNVITFSQDDSNIIKLNMCK